LEVKKMKELRCSDCDKVIAEVSEEVYLYSDDPYVGTGIECKECYEKAETEDQNYHYSEITNEKAKEAFKRL